MKYSYPQITLSAYLIYKQKVCERSRLKICKHKQKYNYTANNISIHYINKIRSLKLKLMIRYKQEISYKIHTSLTCFANGKKVTGSSQSVQSPKDA